MARFKGLRKRLEMLNLLEDHRWAVFVQADGTRIRLTRDQARQAFSETLLEKPTALARVVLNAASTPSYGPRLLELIHACQRTKKEE